jgi:2-polyprenyl-3-methyl-5-hydroxy-6-metoxy-1,4-benzoquinol methylase
MCKKCGFIQQNPIPTCEELNQYYSHHYRLDYKKSNTPKSKHIYRAGKTALHRLEFMKAAGVFEGNLLDVGAGGGEFVYLSNNMGFTSEGIEPNVGYSEYAATSYSCRIKTGGLHDIQGTYDVISMFHVLEHLPSPTLSFEKLYHSLNAEGVLFIEVPWIEANNASPHNIFFKAHIFYFSVDTLIACASPYFDAFKIDTSSNLKILFRAKTTPSEIQYPSHSSVENLQKRMRAKG